MASYNEICILSLLTGSFVIRKWEEICGALKGKTCSKYKQYIIQQNHLHGAGNIFLQCSSDRYNENII